MIRKVFEGLNAAHMLNPPQGRKLLKKYNDDLGNHYIHKEGDNYVTKEYLSQTEPDEMGFTKTYIATEKLSLKDFAINTDSVINKRE